MAWPVRSRVPNSCVAASAPMSATRRAPVSSLNRSDRPVSMSSVRMFWYCGSMPCTVKAAALNRLLTWTAPRCSAALTTAIMPDSRSSARASAVVRKTRRPARSPPACIDVRPPQTMTTFLPSSSSTCWLPRRKPSPVADNTTTEITPQRIPNMVRKLRSLLARRLEKTCEKASCIGAPTRPVFVEADLQVGLSGQNHLLAGLDPAEHLDARAVADANLYRDAAAAGAFTGVRDVDGGVARGVVDDGRFRDEQRVRELFEDDLRVRRHVRFQLAARVVDRHFDLERGHVVALDADRRDLRHPAVEDAIAKGLRRDRRRLPESHLADVGL